MSDTLTITCNVGSGLVLRTTCNPAEYVTIKPGVNVVSRRRWERFVSRNPGLVQALLAAGEVIVEDAPPPAAAEIEEAAAVTPQAAEPETAAPSPPARKRGRPPKAA